MAANSTTERTIKTKLDGESTGGLRRAVREQERELKRLQAAADREHKLFVQSATSGADKVTGALGTMSKGVLGLGSAVGTVQGLGTALAGTAAVASSLSGTLLAAPGIAAAGAAGYGVLALALSGFSDALSAEDAEEFTEATKNMAPAAVETARAIRAQSARMTELKKIIQSRFFEGFSNDVRALADKYFPILNAETDDIAVGFNKMGRNASKALMAPSSVAAVNKILNSTEDTLKELEPAIGNVLGGLLQLGGIGAQRTSALGRAITSATEDFRRWVEQGEKTGRINELIDDGVETAKDLGRVLENVGQIVGKLFDGLSTGERDFLGALEDATQAVEDFLDSAEGQAALKTLGETLQVTADVARDVFKVALEELAPIIIELGPAVQSFARGVGDFLVQAMQTVGPLLQNVAGFLSDNKETVQDLVPLVLGLAVAYKGLKVLTEVATWGAGIPALFGNMGKQADVAAAAVGDPKSGKGLAGRLGGLKGLGTAGLIGAAAFIDLGGVREMSIAETLEKSNLKPQITIGVTADTSVAEAETTKLLDFVNALSGTVTINGNDNPAGFALRRILDEIAQGKETVDINGNQVPAQDALNAVLEDINRTIGTVKINGNDVPAGNALAQLLGRISTSKSDVQVGANTSTAQGVINSFITMNNGKRIDIFVNAKGDMGGIASAGRLATGGRPFFNGRVSGPGTRTNDRAGLFALSRDEHVLSAEEVDAAGGHAAVYAWRRALRTGVRGFADGGTPRYAGATTSAAPMSPSISVAAPEVRVFLGTREITDVVRTEIEQADRQKKRSAAMGRGGAW